MTPIRKLLETLAITTPRYGNKYETSNVLALAYDEELPGLTHAGRRGFIAHAIDKLQDRAQQMLSAAGYPWDGERPMTDHQNAIVRVAWGVEPPPIEGGYGLKDGFEL